MIRFLPEAATKHLAILLSTLLNVSVIISDDFSKAFFWKWKSLVHQLPGEERQAERGVAALGLLGNRQARTRVAEWGEIWSNEPFPMFGDNDEPGGEARCV